LTTRGGDLLKEKLESASPTLNSPAFGQGILIGFKGNKFVQSIGGGALELRRWHSLLGVQQGLMKINLDLHTPSTRADLRIKAGFPYRNPFPNWA